MSAAAPAALAILLAAGALWELSGSRGEEAGPILRGLAAALSGGRVRTLAGAALWLRIPERLQRAGVAERVSVAAVLAGKVTGAFAGAGLAALAAPAVGGRLGIAVSLGLPAAGFLAPDALLERAARRRRARIAASLPDALDLLAAGTAAGRAPATVLAEISRGTTGPLAAEIGSMVAEVECGTPQRDAIASLRERMPGTGSAALAAALERSQRYGSPLAAQLNEQALSLRRDARRRIEERAARAAPKIQLVVALVLVPSVLLLILAALVAHADALFRAM